MLTPDEAANIKYTYRKLMESESKGWQEIDDYLEMLEYLDDLQLYKESEALYGHHRHKNMGCPYNHTPGSACFVANMLESVDSILQLYKKTKNLHVDNRYILCYYLALSQMGQIVELLNS